MEKRHEILEKIEKSGMRLIDEKQSTSEEVKEIDLSFSALPKRCHELIEKYPEKEDLFLNYIKKQEKETDIIENKVTCSTLVIRKGKG